MRRKHSMKITSNIRYIPIELWGIVPFFKTLDTYLNDNRN